MGPILYGTTRAQPIVSEDPGPSSRLNFQVRGTKAQPGCWYSFPLAYFHSTIHGVHGEGGVDSQMCGWFAGWIAQNEVFLVFDDVKVGQLLQSVHIFTYMATHWTSCFYGHTDGLLYRTSLVVWGCPEFGQEAFLPGVYEGFGFAYTSFQYHGTGVCLRAYAKHLFHRSDKQTGEAWEIQLQPCLTTVKDGALHTGMPHHFLHGVGCICVFPAECGEFKQMRQLLL